MSDVLSYQDIYILSEECRQLVGCPLQNASGEGLERCFLDFRLPGQTRTLIIDLTPHRPFFLSTVLTRPKGKKSPSPVVNFLRAHFVGKSLVRWEVAQKPNRTVRLCFDDNSDDLTLTFRCYPHGQQLILMADGKHIVSPRRKAAAERNKETPEAYVEPEPAAQWEFNQAMAEKLLTSSAKQPATPVADRRISKLEKTIAAMDAGLAKSLPETQARIEELEAKALALRSGKAVDGAALDSLYEEIKKFKRKTISNQTRKNELVQQLVRLKTQSALGELPIAELPPKGSSKKAFKGTRVVLDGSWELWVGRNAAQNDELLKLCNPHDWWIHLRDHPGAHGILRGPKKSEPPIQFLEFACRVVAQLSQGRKEIFSEGEKIDFIVVPRKFVKKPKGAAPGRVIIEREQVRRIAFKIVEFQVS
jgi:predicted ribosome quality control (RQC) complex YloA/Tae2 family protein